MIDLSEKILHESGLLGLLLQDKTCRRNILWLTDSVTDFSPTDQIDPDYIADNDVIKPRVVKEKEERLNRTRGKAEVFTPSDICKVQNDQIDELWYKDHKKSDWQSYVLANRMEITCGEAPYLVSRYDTTTGDDIEIKDRIGLLDRKLHLISKYVESEEEWLKWAKLAYKHTYGYEWQGDSLLLARENLYATFTEYFHDKFGKEPNKEDCVEICEIISWNIFQMDGLTFTIPMTDIPAKIMDWDDGEAIEFRSLLSQEEPKAKKKQGKKKLEPEPEKPVEQPYKAKKKRKRNAFDPDQLLLFDESFFQ